MARDPDRNYNSEDGMIIAVGSRVIHDGEAAHLGLPPLTEVPVADDGLDLQTAVAAYEAVFGDAPDVDGVAEEKESLAAELLIAAVGDNRPFASDDEFTAALAYGED